MSKIDKPEFWLSPVRGRETRKARTPKQREQVETITGADNNGDPRKPLPKGQKTP